MIELSKRIALIQAHDFFRSLNEQQNTELAKLAFEKSFAPEKLIVIQGEAVDAVYLIAEGEIEVYVKDKLKVLLHQGGDIGLSQIGFYSQSGQRTATLKAITEVELLGWGLEVLQKFLEDYPTFHGGMRETTEKMLRLRELQRDD